jgi:phage baseplate assembly protein W
MADGTADRELLRTRLLGWSPECDAIEPGVDLGRDLTLVDGPNGRDLGRVTGMDALAQALTVALTTALGSDLFNTQFGFDGLNALVEETNPILAQERIRISVIQVVRADPRVRRIVDVQLVDGRLSAPTAADRGPDDADQAVRMRAARELEVRVGFETISGDQATVDLGRLSLNA